LAEIRGGYLAKYRLRGSCEGGIGIRHGEASYPLYIRDFGTASIEQAPDELCTYPQD